MLLKSEIEDMISWVISFSVSRLYKKSMKRIFCLLSISDLWDKVTLGAYFSSGWDLVVCAALISLRFDCYYAQFTAHTYILISLL